MKIIKLACLLLLVTGCSSDSTEEREALKFNQKEIINLLNKQRARGANCGNESLNSVKALKWNSVLAEVADRHAKDMAENGFFSHTGSDDSSADSRIRDSGYTFSYWGENIAHGYSTEKDVFTGWMNSPGHCKNIMNPKISEMGVAKRGGYWVLVLAQPKEQN